MATGPAFVFPGQGSQRIGMLASVPRTVELARLLDAAEALSDLPLARLAAEGPEAALADTRAAQPLLYLSGWGWAVAVEAAGISPSMVAGHSLGELAALAFAGAFSVEAGLELVCARARIMAEVARAMPGTMAAVLGMDRSTVIALLDGADGVWVANDNGAGQVVLSGTHAGIEWASAALSASGARKIVPLSVAGPFHSPLMEPAREAFANVLDGTDFADTRFPVIQNAIPEPTSDADTLRSRLTTQITAPVRWTETMDALLGAGVSTVVETGPGSVLTGLVRRVEGLTAISVDTDGIERVLEVAQG